MSTLQQQIGIESLDVVTVVVDDQDEALDFYTDVLGFEVRTDDEFEMDGVTGRWLTVGLPGQDLEIALAATDEAYYDDDTRETMASKVGTETFWMRRTDDGEATVAALEAAGVEITREPVAYEWGTEAAFADPFGNELGLFESAAE